MKRRNFFEAASIMGLMAVLPNSPFGKSNLSKDESSDFEMGYQLYSIRDKMAEDAIGTINALKTFGYSHFEIYGYDPGKNLIYGYEPTEFKKIMDDLDVRITSGHYGFSDYFHSTEDDLFKFVDQCHACAEALGSQYITWPWIAPELRKMENYRLMPQKLNKIGRHLTGSNLKFAYHNHGFEFVDHNGETGFDILLNETDPKLVKFQMDMYWVMHSSLSTTPKKLVKDNPGRFVMWHIKDMDAETRDYTELGNGSINYLNVLPDAKESGLEFLYIEQGGNFAVDSLESAKQSALYYQKNL